MGNPVTYTLQLAAASANNIATTQTPSGAGNLTLNGSTVVDGVAILDVARRVLITCAGNNSGVTFTIYGTNHTGSPIYETITGPNTTTAQSTFDYKTVTRIAISGASTGSLTVGTSSVGSTPWIISNIHAITPSIGLTCVVSGTVNYTVEYTPDNIMTTPLLTAPTAIAHPTLAIEDATAWGYFDFPIYGYRLTINSGTGSVTFTGIQAGIKG
ncbi:hypothetical protein [Ancylobacter sp.]|uniref:hypothetical protein n=1 Tax=Ancylobacter sp. TaxID=1872567 RepID=UPI003BADBE4E